jgi:hypothetical protein
MDALSPSLEHSCRVKDPAAFLQHFAEWLDALHDPDAHWDFQSYLLFAESTAYLHLIVRNYCPVNEDSVAECLRTLESELRDSLSIEAVQSRIGPLQGHLRTVRAAVAEFPPPSMVGLWGIAFCVVAVVIGQTDFFNSLFRMVTERVRIMKMMDFFGGLLNEGQK